MPNRILIPHDGSEFSRQIFSHVSKLLAPQANELILLRIVPLPAGITGSPPRPLSADVPMPMYGSEVDAEYAQHPIFASQELENLKAKALEELEDDARQLRNAGFKVTVDCHAGDAAHEIVKFSTEEKIDAIAMTTHGRSGLSRIIFGSVAHAVLRDVAVPILLLRPAQM
jgi:nucleotide-binding universal stress UspA family protein